jgi:peptidoglycan-associated lipoprotein
MVRKRRIAFLAVLVSISFFIGCVSMSRYKQLESETSKLRGEREELLARISEEELEAMPVPTEISALRGKVLVEVPEIGDVYFEFDKWNLTPTAREILTKNAAWIKKNHPVEVLIEGHCDERGTVDYNLALGDRRAKSARKYLILLGCDADRIFTISYGEETPVDPGHNEEAWAKNRRAHSRVVAP